MAQSSLRNNKRLFSVSGGDPSLPDRVTYLENNEYKILYFQTISATTGTITKPTNSTILLDQFYEGGDAIVETLVNSQPSGQSPLTSTGAVVSVSSFDTSGNFTLSGTPAAFDVALVYILKIKAEDYQNLTTANIMAMDFVDQTKTSIQLACSDETTALTAGNGKITFRMPYPMKVTAVRASLTTAQTSGNIFTVDINEGVNSILSTKITIDNGEKTSTTAATLPVISDSTLSDDAEITIDIDQIGDGTAKGLKVSIIGYIIQ